MTKELVPLWKANDLVKIDKNLSKASDIISYAVQISDKEKKQIVSGFASQSYEMASNFVWQKSIKVLKRQISKLGMQFIAEMLNRDDIYEGADVDAVLTDYEAIRLAEDLGMLSSTGGFRLRQARDKVAHFNELDERDAEEEELTRDEARSILRSCVENVLAKDKIEVSLDFQSFRTELVTRVLLPSDGRISMLLDSPYFYQRTTIRVLMALAKSSNGAQLETSLANLNVILPMIWDKVQEPERWQVGKTYADMIAEGRTSSGVGLKSALLKVKGFDYVPENLRSRSFLAAAHEIQKAHDGINNFYNEPGPMAVLAGMGTSIPTPAFPTVMRAVLSVVLGNPWGVCNAAQSDADKVLRSVSQERWKYFIDHCLPSDERILGKLTSDKPARRWVSLSEQYNLGSLVASKNEMQRLLKFSTFQTTEELKKVASQLYFKLGYKDG